MVITPASPPELELPPPIIDPNRLAQPNRPRSSGNRGRAVFPPTPEQESSVILNSPPPCPLSLAGSDSDHHSVRSADWQSALPELRPGLRDSHHSSASQQSITHDPPRSARSSESYSERPLPSRSTLQPPPLGSPSSPPPSPTTARPSQRRARPSTSGSASSPTIGVGPAVPENISRLGIMMGRMSVASELHPGWEGVASMERLRSASSSELRRQS
jgi:hypothetical protein